MENKRDCKQNNPKGAKVNQQTLIRHDDSK